MTMIDRRTMLKTLLGGVAVAASGVILATGQHAHPPRRERVYDRAWCVIQAQRGMGLFLDSSRRGAKIGPGLLGVSRDGFGTALDPRSRCSAGKDLSMGLFGILAALILLIFLAYRGWSVLLLSPAAALLAAALAGEPLLAHWTQTFMGSAARFIMQF
jgi:hypothetical protein